MKAASLEAIGKAQAMFSKPEPVIEHHRHFDLGAYLAHYNIEVIKIKQNGPSSLHCLKECIFDPSHAPNDAAIGMTVEGKLFYQCFHASCKGRAWEEARERISGNEPLAPFKLGTDERAQNGESVISSDDPMRYFKTGAQLQALDAKVEWVVNRLIAEQAINTLIGPAGNGKTVLTLNIADAVVRGNSWLGLQTKRMPVYVLDYENPLPVIVDRVRTLKIEEVLFWHTSAEKSTPRIDSDEYTILKKLPPGLFIVDGHRASQHGDENSSKDTGLVMERWKEFGILVILSLSSITLRRRMNRCFAVAKR